MFFLKFFCGNVDLKVDEFLQFDGKHKCNRLYLQLKNVNYPANNFGRLTISIAHIGLKTIFSNTFKKKKEVNVKKFKHDLSDISFDS